MTFFHLKIKSFTINKHYDFLFINLFFLIIWFPVHLHSLIFIASLIIHNFLILSFYYIPIIIVSFITTFIFDSYKSQFIGILFIQTIVIDFSIVLHFLKFIKFINKVTDSIFLINRFI
jgi:hypothetical protein